MPLLSQTKLDHSKFSMIDIDQPEDWHQTNSDRVERLWEIHNSVMFYNEFQEILKTYKPDATGGIFVIRRVIFEDHLMCDFELLIKKVSDNKTL